MPANANVMVIQFYENVLLHIMSIFTNVFVFRNIKYYIWKLAEMAYRS